jgi:acyl-CoA dehydrogenase
LRTLAHACPSTALALSMHTHQVLVPAWRWRHERAPVERFLRRVAAEELVIATSGGSDWLTGSGRADKVEGGYRVSGRKIFASGSPAADILATMAIYDDPSDGAIVLHFAIPFDSPGVTRHDNWRTLGMRGTGSHDVTLDRVFVPDSAISARRGPPASGRTSGISWWPTRCPSSTRSTSARPKLLATWPCVRLAAAATITQCRRS